MTTPEEARKLTICLYEKAAGKRNSVGDSWGDWVCRDSASALLDLADQVEQYKKDAERLLFIHKNLEWDGIGYWLPDWCVVEVLDDQNHPAHPTIEQLREFIDMKGRIEP